jgi:hypothetical protein
MYLLFSRQKRKSPFIVFDIMTRRDMWKHFEGREKLYRSSVHAMVLLYLVVSPITFKAEICVSAELSGVLLIYNICMILIANPKGHQ